MLLKNGIQQACDTPPWHLTYGTLLKFKAILTKGISDILKLHKKGRRPIFSIKLMFVNMGNEYIKNFNQDNFRET